MTGGDLLRNWWARQPQAVRPAVFPANVSASDLAWLKARKQGAAVDRAVQALRRST